MDAVKLMGEIIRETAEYTREDDSLGCAKLVVFCNAPDDNPFMAGAFHGVTEADKIINVGVSGPGVVKTALEKVRGESFEILCETIKKTAFKITRIGQLVAHEASKRLDTPFGIGSNPGCSLGYTKLTNDLYWSGDHRSGYGYNQLVSINNIPDLNVSNSEHLLEVAPDYYYAMNIGCNPSNTIGKGFAFFIHCYGPDPYTEGCVAIPRDCMKSLLTNVRPGCVIIIDYESNLCS